VTKKAGAIFSDTGLKLSLACYWRRFAQTRMDGEFFRKTNDDELRRFAGVDRQ
jgi:hypothetical protein